jgi:hypothetical protein
MGEPLPNSGKERKEKKERKERKGNQGYVSSRRTSGHHQHQTLRRTVLPQEKNKCLLVCVKVAFTPDPLNIGSSVAFSQPIVQAV